MYAYSKTTFYLFCSTKYTGIIGPEKMYNVTYNLNKGWKGRACHSRKKICIYFIYLLFYLYTILYFVKYISVKYLVVFLTRKKNN